MPITGNKQTCEAIDFMGTNKMSKMLATEEIITFKDKLENYSLIKYQMKYQGNYWDYWYSILSVL